MKQYIILAKDAQDPSREVKVIPPDGIESPAQMVIAKDLADYIFDNATGSFLAGFENRWKEKSQERQARIKKFVKKHKAKRAKQ